MKLSFYRNGRQFLEPVTRKSHGERLPQTRIQFEYLVREKRGSLGLVDTKGMLDD